VGASARARLAGAFLIPPALSIHLITDRRRLISGARTIAGELAALDRWLDDAIDRVDVIQVRERDVPAGALAALVRSLAARVRGTRTTLLVNDRADVALAGGASGCHLRSDGPPIDRVRAMSPAPWLVGRSVHSLDEASKHAAADYLIFGTMFPTDSKPAGVRPQGLDALRAVTRAVRTPVIAIGPGARVCGIGRGRCRGDWYVSAARCGRSWHRGCGPEAARVTRLGAGRRRC
jgi:thiamine-phosphate diphosphorylase